MRLLQKTIRTYFFYSFFVLLVAVPLFYFIIKGIVARDVDKALVAQKEALVRKLDRAVLFDPFDLLSALEPDINLLPSQTIRLYDTLYTSRQYDPLTRQMIPYRHLTSNVVIRGQYYVIQLKSSLVNNQDLIKSIVLVEIILLILIGVGLFLINESLASLLWKPFYATLNKLRHYNVEQGDPIRFHATDIAEFNDLNQTLQQLTDRSRLAYQSQKEFIENASHEIQTPLAVIQSKLELLMQTQPLTPEQAALISSLNDANSRLSRLNKSLLLLTRIENNQYAELEDVNVQSRCKEIVSQLEYQVDVKEIEVATVFRADVTLCANRVLFDVLITNLLVNAIRYNVQGGKILIALDNEALTVENTGSDTPLNPEKIFERFQKENTSSKSMGLGLAIVKRICQLYDYSISYGFKDQHTHVFRVTFKK